MILELFADSIKNQVSGQSDGRLEDSVMALINAAFAVVGIVAVVVIILGGISYMTSEGDPNKITKGKKTIIGGLIGLAVVILAAAIVNFVLNSL